MDMERVMRVAAGAALCLALTNYWGAANSQQANAPEAIRPEICDEFDVDGRICSSARRGSSAVAELHNPYSEWFSSSRSQLHSWRGQPNTDDPGA
jgi:hypothetical protein